MKIRKTAGIATALVLSLTVLLTGCAENTSETLSIIADESSTESLLSSDTEERASSAASEITTESSAEATEPERSDTSNPSSNNSAPSSKPAGNQNTDKPSNSNSPSYGGTVSKPSASGNNSSSSAGKPDNSGSASTSDTKPSVHTHHFVDVGVQSMDWTYAQEPGYTGPTNTREKVSAINACLRCGYYYGNDEGELFANRFAEHVFAPGSCGGNYSLRTVYACYHLLECTTPGCYAYRRGKLDHYEYLMYFNGNGEEPTPFVLQDWQIKELGLPMP